MKNFATRRARSKNTHDPNEYVSDWPTALQLLVDGNWRYLNDQTAVERRSAERRKALEEEQRPFAAIITCSDSRVSPEIYFDQKLGALFVIRNVGNIADRATMGSIEYAVEYLRVPLVVVVGHSECGAINAAFNGGVYPKNLQFIIETINEAIQGCSTVQKATRANTKRVRDQIRENSAVLERDVQVLGAHYFIETGEVVFEVL